MFRHTSPAGILRMLRIGFCGFGCVIFIGFFIPTYDIAGSCRCIGVADNTINGILAIFVRSESPFVKQVVILVVIALASFFRGFAGLCSAGHPNHTDVIFDPILYNTKDFEYNTHDLI